MKEKEDKPGFTVALCLIEVHHLLTLSITILHRLIYYGHDFLIPL